MSSTSILLFGADGQVGSELQRTLSAVGSVTPLTIADLDLTDTMALRAAIRRHRPRAIVNAAAYTAVDKAETEADVARAVNASAPSVMAEEARALGAWLVHYSTDYVYDGSKPGAYLEDDRPNPLSVYGRTKLEGDEAIRSSGAQHAILRTSWVFGSHGGNFLKTILQLARDRDALSVVDDQIGAPTSAELLAETATLALVAALRGKLEGGLYHLTAAGETSWHGYATYVVTEARRSGAALALHPERIRAIPSEEYPRPAARPKNSRLDCTRIRRALDLELPDWQFHVRRTLQGLLPS